MGILGRIMSAAGSAKDQKLVAEQRFLVRVRHKMGIPFSAMAKWSNRVNMTGDLSG